MKNETWRGSVNLKTQKATPAQCSKSYARLVLLVALTGFGLLIVVLHNLPSSGHHKRFKRGELRHKSNELEQKHNEYMRMQAAFTHKNYFFPKHDFEPDFRGVTGLSPTCPNRCSDATCKHVQRSTLYSTCCNTSTTNVTWIFPLLITATPRSGTVATLNLFRALGLELGDDWDKPGQHGRISWIHGFNEFDHVQIRNNQQAMAYYGQPHKLLVGDRFRVIIHLVRDPLSSITSIACTEPLADIQWSEYVRTHVPMEKWGSRGKRIDFFHVAMQMWLEWHQFLDDLCLFRIRLEDLFSATSSHSIVHDIFTLINQPLPSADEVDAALHEVEGSRNKNQRDHRPKVTWQELFQVNAGLTRRVWERSCLYGYHCDVDIVSVEAAASVVAAPVCEFEEDTDRGWSPGLVSALPPDLRPQ